MTEKYCDYKKLTIKTYMLNIMLQVNECIVFGQCMACELNLSVHERADRPTCDLTRVTLVKSRDAR